MIEVSEATKNALRDGDTRKVWHIDVYDADEKLWTISNSNLVSESIEIDERLCSGTSLKFGLCEGSVLKFKYFGMDDITDKHLKVSVDVNEETIPMGWYDVGSCITQKSTGQRKVTAYNKLKSSFLDEKANKKIVSIYTILGENKLNIDQITGALLTEYKIDSDYNVLSLTSLVNNVRHVKYAVKSQDGKMIYTPLVSITFTASNSVYNERLRWKFNGTALREKLRQILGDNADKVGRYYDGNYLTQRSDTVLNFLCGALTNADTYTKPSYYVHAYNDKFDIDIAESDKEVKTNYYTAISVKVDFPIDCVVTDDTVPDYEDNFVDAHYSTAEFNAKVDEIKTFLLENIELDELEPTMIGSRDLTRAQAEALPDVTLRELQSAIYETECQFGELNRETDLFAGIELNGAGLQPRDGLYPATGLYPRGESEHTYKSIYSNLFTNDEDAYKWHKLIITYKAVGSDGNEVERTLERTINSDGNINYNMSSNWIFRNLVWTSDLVGIYADRMVDKMQDMTWFPFEMDAVGLPYLETGDMLEIATESGTERSYILERRLKGLQNLEDEISCGSVETF